MSDKTYLNWPFFEDAHRTLAANIERWCSENPALFEKAHSLPLDKACRIIVNTLGQAGWLKYVVPKPFGGIYERLDLRSICLIRESLAQRSGLVEFCFAMQGLGVGPVSMFGSDALKTGILPKIASGEAIGAFAISETAAGSDLGAMQTTAVRDGAGYVINGEKTWISNAGIADCYVVFCRMAEAKKYVALLVPAGTPGLSVTARMDVMAPH